MKKFIITSLLSVMALTALASTMVWDLYSLDGKHSITLAGTTWASTIDGERIYFTAEGEGVFENGVHFGWSPPIAHYHGMSTCPDQPTEMQLFKGGKQFNTLRLRWKGNGDPTLLVDKRGVTYKKI